MDPEGVGFLPPPLRALPSLTTDCLMSKLLYTCERSPFVSTRLDPGVPGIWYKHHSGNGCENVINIWIHRLDKADCPLSCGWVGLIKSVEALHKTEKLPLLQVKGNTPDSCLERTIISFLSLDSHWNISSFQVSSCWLQVLTCTGLNLPISILMGATSF